MKIVILGSGAMGLLYGGLINRSRRRNDHEVFFLANSGWSALRDRPLEIRSIWGDFFLDLKSVVYRNPMDLPGADLVVVCIKTTANDHLAEFLAPLRRFQPALLSLQNGLGNEEMLAQIAPEAAVFGGTAFLCSNRLSPTEIFHSQYGLVQIAEYQRCSPGKIQRIADIFQTAGIPCQIQENYWDMRMRKQVWNVAFNGLCTLYNVSTFRILDNAQWLSQARAIMLEVIALGVAAVREFSPTWTSSMSAAFADDQIAKTSTMGEYLPSMLLDRRANRPMEIAGIITACRTLADRLAIQIPNIERLDRDLRRIAG